MKSIIAHKLENSSATQRNKKNQSIDKNISFENQIIENFSGPALIINNSHQIIEHNIYADNLVAALEKHNAALNGLIMRCLNNSCPDNQKITLEDDVGVRHYDLFAFPVKSENDKSSPSVLMFGKDTTVEQHLTKALVDSRQMFKDLVSCSTDFAWETDNKGRFKYVSPNGILGYTAYDLNDKSASNLIVGDDGINPFDTLDTINDVEIWLQRNDGSFACVQVSASPVIDNNSTWQGARGVCRDITIMREREASLRRIQKNEHVLKKIISTIRDEIDPSKILHTTAFAALDGITAKHCYIVELSRDADAQPILDLKAESGEVTDLNIFKELCKITLAICGKSKDQLPLTYLEEEVDGYRALVGLSRHHNKINGAIYILNEKNDKEWNKDEKSLFAGVTSHLGIALEQIKNYEKLQKLSSTDELTSLLNRRAFCEKTSRRLIIQKRHKQTCALLYIDLDNFKQVNDTYGHAKGDEVLRNLSTILENNTREEDFCSRLGGDEFAVWLEGVDENTAVVKAKNILDRIRELQKLAENEDAPLSLSIGIALSSPEAGLSLDTLMDNADKALYDVKKSGKSNILLSQVKDF